MKNDRGSEALLGQGTDWGIHAATAAEGASGREIAPLALAFEIGGLLNRLDWHQHLAIFCGHSDSEADATNGLTQLELCVKGLFPAERGGKASDEIQRMQKYWDGILTEQWVCEQWHNSFLAANEPHDSDYEPDASTEHKCDLITSLASMVPRDRAELTKIMKTKFRRSQKMWLACQLAKCIDEGVCPRNIREHLINPSFKREQRMRDRHQRRLHARGDTRGRLSPAPPMVQFESVFRSLGELPPAPGWYEEVNILWHKLRVPTMLPSPDVGVLEEPTGRVQFHRQLVNVAREGMWQITVDDWSTESAERDWPPDDGWCFRERQFAYLKRKGEANGNMLKLLKALAEARFPQEYVDLNDKV